MNELKKKLKALESDQPSGWKKNVLFRNENRDWLKKSSALAVKVLQSLKEQKITQKELAERLNISPQQVSKILQGQENLTFQTVTAIENALGIELIRIPHL
jgi:DNA-binding Xre family transcriptional regulator